MNCAKFPVTPDQCVMVIQMYHVAAVPPAGDTPHNYAGFPKVDEGTGLLNLLAISQ